MGNLFSKKEAAPAVKQYSWDTRPQRDPSDFTFAGRTGETLVKKPGEVGGDQFSIDKCENCNIYLLDNAATVTIDNCKNCNIFVGPTKSSLFVRNCSELHIIAAVQQFRSRDCHHIDALLCCTTLPIIEASRDMRFGCFRGTYFELIGQFTAATITPYLNNWSRIHDFTPQQGTRNYSLLSQDPDWLSTFTHGAVELDFARDKALVPITTSPAQRPSGEICFVMLFHPAQTAAKKVFRELVSSSVAVVQVFEVTVKGGWPETFFAEHKEHVADCALGPVIGAEIVGEGASAAVANACAALKSKSFATSDSATARKKMDSFFSYVESVCKV
eukprot:m.237088 g.237088  ORF g.237088 m.237088 type:complete len:330 (+) comp20934_c0_seq1:27-1016(+)